MFRKEKFEHFQSTIGKDPDRFANVFYDSVMSKSDEFQQVFRNTDIRLQKLEIIKGFFKIFSLLESPKELSQFLQDLGLRHVCYEVRPEHYPMIVESLMETMIHLSGANWNNQHQNIWKTLLQYMTDEMLIGAQKIDIG